MNFKTIKHEADFCVVGGGLSGMCAAIAAARHGVKTTLIQERPVLGGNCSSEIRMWVCGAQGKNTHETGIIEEIMLENQYRNTDKNYSVWDSVLFEAVKKEENIDLLLNCSVLDCEIQGQRIVAVKGWQMTTQTYHVVYAPLFSDCSGDSVLAPLTGAKYRVGREAASEFGESIGLETADSKTMGMSCMLQAREEDHPSTFIPPKWAYHYKKEDLPHRIPDMASAYENFWYLEIGGDADSIADTEQKRDELLKIAFGIWDFVKNDPENKEKNANWRLDWMGFLPGKRESRRYEGDIIMTQNDVQSGGHFDDIVAYGGWQMDDHDPRGFYSGDHPNINYPAPSPYGIAYRTLYSQNIENLFCAGRNISVTHWALSSTRVMATCALLGQAVGTAAAVATKYHLSPRGVYQQKLTELQDLLMDDDCYLPYMVRKIPTITQNANLTENYEALRNGLDRPISDVDNGVMVDFGDTIEYRFAQETEISSARIVFDSDLNRDTMPEVQGIVWPKNMLHNRPWHCPEFSVPKTLVKAYRIEGVCENGDVTVLYETDENHQRLNKIQLSGKYIAVRLVPVAAWGADRAHIFSFEIA